MAEVFKDYIYKKAPTVRAAKIRRAHAFGSQANICQVELTGSPRGEVVTVHASVGPVRGDYVVFVDGKFIHVQKAEFNDRYRGV